MKNKIIPKGKSFLFDNRLEELKEMSGFVRKLIHVWKDRKGLPGVREIQKS
ncbi:MAG: hypothetical protein M3405_17185 [Acidobacteriota bacterium]|jgi:hypothetical protein|nr:hypothetical protein [Acidobacteriota bacterium]